MVIIDGLLSTDQVVVDATKLIVHITNFHSDLENCYTMSNVWQCYGIPHHNHVIASHRRWNHGGSGGPHTKIQTIVHNNMAIQ